MPLPNPAKFVDAASVNRAQLKLLEFVNPHAEWFISEDGRLPLEVNRTEFDFSVAHGRLIFSCWTQRGARAWRVTDWNQAGEKLVLPRFDRPVKDLFNDDFRAAHCKAVARSW